MTGSMLISRRTILSAASALITLTLFTQNALADELSVSVSGNGSGSFSAADVDISSTTTVIQTNTADVVNNIDLSANTGDNSATNNTDGDTTITTGDITQNVDVLNVANANGTNDGASYTQETNVNISDNGTGSTNNVTIDLTNDRDIDQSNDANIENNINLDANTGGNNASGNTGGSVNVSSGDVSQTTSITNCLNLNWFGALNPLNCPKPEGGPGDQPAPGEPSVTPTVTQVLSQAGPSSSSSSSSSSGSSGEVLGVSTLPLTGVNIYGMAAFSLILMMAGFLLIRKSYDFELALIKVKRGRYYNKDSL